MMNTVQLNRLRCLVETILEWTRDHRLISHFEIAARDLAVAVAEENRFYVGPTAPPSASDQKSAVDRGLRLRLAEEDVRILYRRLEPGCERITQVREVTWKTVSTRYYTKGHPATADVEAALDRLYPIDPRD